MNSTSILLMAIFFISITYSHPARYSATGNVYALGDDFLSASSNGHIERGSLQSTGKARIAPLGYQGPFDSALGGNYNVYARGFETGGFGAGAEANARGLYFIFILIGPVLKKYTEASS